MARKTKTIEEYTEEIKSRIGRKFPTVGFRVIRTSENEATIGVFPGGEDALAVIEAAGALPTDILVETGIKVWIVPMSPNIAVTGRVFKDGTAVGDGTSVKAMVGTTECAWTTTVTDAGDRGRYVMQITPEACRCVGATVTFEVAGLTAVETLVVTAATGLSPQVLDLHVVTPRLVPAPSETGR